MENGNWQERAEAAEEALKHIEHLLALTNVENLTPGNLRRLREAHKIAQRGRVWRWEHTPETHQAKAEFTCTVCKRLFKEHTFEEYALCMDTMIEGGVCVKCGRPFWKEHKREDHPGADGVRRWVCP